MLFGAINWGTLIGTLRKQGVTLRLLGLEPNPRNLHLLNFSATHANLRTLDICVSLGIHALCTRRDQHVTENEKGNTFRSLEHS